MKEEEPEIGGGDMEKCAGLTRGLLAVPREELERKLKQHGRKKGKAKKSD